MKPNMAVEHFILQDRQWLRHCRIAHAKYQLNFASNKEEKEFWETVLLANTIG